MPQEWTPVIVGMFAASWVLLAAGAFIASSAGRPINEVLDRALSSVGDVSVGAGFVGLAVLVAWIAGAVVKIVRRLTPSAVTRRVEK